MSHARAAVNAVNRCNMTLIPQPGKEKNASFISKKLIAFTQQIFLIGTFFHTK